VSTAFGVRNKTLSTACQLADQKQAVMACHVPLPARLLCALLCLAPLGGVARITSTEIREDDRPGILLSQPFGFGANGHLDFQLSNVIVQNKALHGDEQALQRIGFYLAQNTGDEIAEDPSFTTEADPRCRFLDRRGDYVVPVVSFQKQSISKIIRESAAAGQGSTGTYTHSVDQTKLGNGGMDALFFANCVPTTAVSFDIKIEMYNVDRWGNKNYLSVGELEMPTMLLVRCHVDPRAAMFVLSSCATTQEAQVALRLLKLACAQMR
jgi:G protein-coupled receptor 107